MKHFIHDHLDFEYYCDGPDNGEPVVLLHGFPQNASCWHAVVPILAASGYRVLALNQRGYSPGARPRPVSSYRITKLVSDTVAFIKQVGGGKVHLVGHDLGGEVAWIVACTVPDVVQSLTIVSTPHPRALTRALFTTDQLIRSWYLSFIQLPVIPEKIFRARHGEIAVWLLGRFGLENSLARQYVDYLLVSPGALRAAINWYRAFPLEPRLIFAAPRISTNTQLIWGTNDAVVTREVADLTQRYVSGPYRFSILQDISHWIPDQAPDQLSELILKQARSYPIAITSADQSDPRS
jgi:pimeloyl-ACP methyl ester carboxylesterase